MTVTEHKAVEDNKYIMEVRADAKEFLDAIEKAYQKEKGKINIQGFRKGHAPRKIIEKMYGDTYFFGDAIDGLLPDAFEKAVDEADIEFIGRPDVDVVSIDIDNGAVVKFTVTLRPEFKVKKYKGLEATKHIHPVDNEDVDAELNQMRDKASRLVAVEGRPAEDGDIANIDFEGFIGDEAFDGGKGEGYDLTLGSGQFIAGFEEQIVGKNKGGEFDVNVTFPEDYGAEKLSGKDATFKVKLNDLRKKEFPELDDEFAKDVSEFDTLKELKDDIKKRLSDEREESAKNQIENQLADKLADELEGDVPEVMIEERIDDLARDFAYRLSQQGLSIDNYLKYLKQDTKQFRDGFAEQAKKQVKTRLALESVVRAEKIAVSDEDVEKEYADLAEQYGMSADEIKKSILPKTMKRDLAVQKAIDVLREKAKIIEEKHEHKHEHKHEEK